MMMTLGSETLRHDLVLNLKKCWFEKVWRGEKTTEYREVKPYWTKRIGKWVGGGQKFVMMRLGYKRQAPAVLVQVGAVDIGKCPYDGWVGEYYRLHFAIVGYYFIDGGKLIPVIPNFMSETKEGDK